MKAIVYALTVLILMSTAFAAVTKNTGTAGDNVFTYNSAIAPDVNRGYWAVYDVVPAGCTVSSVSCSASGNADCAYYSPDNSIRVVAYTNEAGGGVANSVTMTVQGTGSCTLSGGQYVESWNDGTPVLGSITSFTTDADIVLSSTCNEASDSNGDCTISLSELITYAQLWIDNAGVTLSQVIAQAEIWVAGGGY